MLHWGVLRPVVVTHSYGLHDSTSLCYGGGAMHHAPPRTPCWLVQFLQFQALRFRMQILGEIYQRVGAIVGSFNEPG